MKPNEGADDKLVYFLEGRERAGGGHLYNIVRVVPADGVRLDTNKISFFDPTAFHRAAAAGVYNNNILNAYTRGRPDERTCRSRKRFLLTRGIIAF